MKKGLKYYVINYIPYAFEIDIAIKNAVVKRMRQKMQKRKNQQLNVSHLKPIHLFTICFLKLHKHTSLKYIAKL